MFSLRDGMILMVASPRDAKRRRVVELTSNTCRALARPPTWFFSEKTTELREDASWPPSTRDICGLRGALPLCSRSAHPSADLYSQRPISPFPEPLILSHRLHLQGRRLRLLSGLAAPAPAPLQNFLPILRVRSFAWAIRANTINLFLFQTRLRFT